MPNGWYPVAGLDIIHLNRTEQRYPRLEWGQSWDDFWAAEFTGARGFTPRGQFVVPYAEDRPHFERLVEAARALIAGDPQLESIGSAVAINFKRKEGWAVGSFCVYGFNAGTVTVLHDHTLGAMLLREGKIEAADLAEHAYAKNVMTSCIDAKGLSSPAPENTWHFTFGEMDALVVSSTALHYDAHWPPKNSLDCVVMALADDKRRDALIALWKPEDGK